MLQYTGLCPIKGISEFVASAFDAAARTGCGSGAGSSAGIEIVAADHVGHRAVLVSDRLAVLNKPYNQNNSTNNGYEDQQPEPARLADIVKTTENKAKSGRKSANVTMPLRISPVSPNGLSTTPIRKVKSTHHQYSEREARPVKQQYLSKPILMASINVTCLCISKTIRLERFLQMYVFISILVQKDFFISQFFLYLETVVGDSGKFGVGFRHLC